MLQMARTGSAGAGQAGFAQFLKKIGDSRGTPLAEEEVRALTEEMRSRGIGRYSDLVAHRFD